MRQQGLFDRAHALVEQETANGIRYYRRGPGGESFPAVTSVLGWVFKKPSWYGYNLTAEDVIRARKRASAVHLGAELAARGLPWETAVRGVPGGRERVEAFRRFLVDHTFTLDSATMKLFSPAYRYAGRLDFVGSFLRGGSSVALVTLVVDPTDADDRLYLYQTAAYRELWHELTGAGTTRASGSTNARRPAYRFVLRLFEDGRYDLEDVDASRAATSHFTVFLSALNCFLAAHRAQHPRSPHDGPNAKPQA